MLKEIYEEPKVVKNTLNAVTTEGEVIFGNMPFTAEDFKALSRIYIVGCGSESAFNSSSFPSTFSIFLGRRWLILTAISLLPLKVLKQICLSLKRL